MDQGSKKSKGSGRSTGTNSEREMRSFRRQLAELKAEHEELKARLTQHIRYMHDDPDKNEEE